jgi:dihydroorotate dehydrogenase
LDGLIVSNTTIERTELKTTSEKVSKIGAGGLSGMPLKNRSTDLVKYICTNAKNKIPVIASGGIFNGTDAQEKLASGASLVQYGQDLFIVAPQLLRTFVTSSIKEIKNQHFYGTFIYGRWYYQFCHISYIRSCAGY